MTRASAGTGSIYKTTITSKGHAYEYWCAQTDITDDDGKREYVRGFAPVSLGDAKAQALAIKRRNAKLSKILLNGKPVPTPKSEKVSTVLEQWLSSYAPDDLTDAGKQKYRRDFELHILPFLDVGIATITKKDLQDLFWRTLPEHGRTPRSVYNAYRALSTMLTFAVAEDKIERNVAKVVKVKRPASAVSADDDKWINRRVSMTKHMLAWLDDPQRCGPEFQEHYPLILMMMLGLRRGELLGLEWSCVFNLDRKGKASIQIKQQLQRAKGEGWFIHPTTKNKKARNIPLPELWRLALIQQRDKQRKASEEWANDLIFLLPPNADGVSRWTDYNTYNEIWHNTLATYVNHRREIKQPIREDEKWRPHAQRHVAASLMFDEGVPLEAAQEILGHSDVAMTAYYTHMTRSMKTDATLSLERGLTAAKNKQRAKKQSEDTGGDYDDDSAD